MTKKTFFSTLSPVRNFFVPPAAVSWVTPDLVKAHENLLREAPFQAVLEDSSNVCCTLKNKDGKAGGILLDFGRELHGGIEMVVGALAENRPVKMRVRFGESAIEAMSEIGGDGNATNDHAIRDDVMLLPSLGRRYAGDTGFRFVYIGLVDADCECPLLGVRALCKMRDLEYRGEFQCNDERLNKIWRTGAYTVHLNMQEYLWEGIKRDRLVWVGDMHPEVRTINTVFGFQDIVPRSLDLMTSVTPPDKWMNGIGTYSMWWIIIQSEWYWQHGDKDYLSRQLDYLEGLVKHLARFIDDRGGENIDGWRFLDWSTGEDANAIAAGIQALLAWAMKAAAIMFNALERQEMLEFCQAAYRRVRKHVRGTNGIKQPVALQVLAGQCPADRGAAECLLHSGTRGISTFYGYYVLEALAMAGCHEQSLTIIRDYWGGMLDLGATTFWEEFDLEWTHGAAGIDVYPVDPDKSIHSSHGNHCYKGLRRSLCHGWASGPTPWLTRHVLGIETTAPGGRQIRIEPHLGDLHWCEGRYPTPYGNLQVRHERKKDGSTATEYTAPDEVQIHCSSSSV